MHFPAIANPPAARMSKAELRDDVSSMIGMACPALATICKLSFSFMLRITQMGEIGIYPP